MSDPSPTKLPYDLLESMVPHLSEDAVKPMEVQEEPIGSNFSDLTDLDSVDSDGNTVVSQKAKAHLGILVDQNDLDFSAQTLTSQISANESPTGGSDSG